MIDRTGAQHRVVAKQLAFAIQAVPPSRLPLGDASRAHHPHHIKHREGSLQLHGKIPVMQIDIIVHKNED